MTAVEPTLKVDGAPALAETERRKVYQLDPLQDLRWARFVDKRLDSSIFHDPGWLKALNRTYGYEPVVYTTSPPQAELTNGIVFCKIRSWMTGRRAVSLPFSDHCQPLVEDDGAMNALLGQIRESVGREHWRYFELRPRVSAGIRDGFDLNLDRSEQYLLHALDVRPELDTLFRNFQKSSVQRKIRRAEREGLCYEEGRSERLLRQFYDLLILTRRRHGVPPQPLVWFRNLIAALPDKAIIRMASKDGLPVASILTISHQRSLVYKYGCSDARFHNLGGTALLFWKAIQDAKRSGALEFDMGRSDCANAGLISFKENWGAAPSRLEYWRCSVNGAAVRSGSSGRRRAVEAVFSRMPNAVLKVAGKLLYRHIG